MQVFLQTLIGGLSLGAIYALVAMGFSIVYRTMGLVNFAHGNVVMVGAYIASTFYLTVTLPFALAMVVAVVVTALIGLVIEGVLRPLETKDVDLMLIGTIGFGIVLRRAGRSSSGARPGGPCPPRFRPRRWTSPACVIRPYDLVVIAVARRRCRWRCGAFLRRTKARHRHAGGRHGPEAATAVGIRVGRSNAIAFGIGAGARRAGRRHGRPGALRQPRARRRARASRASPRAILGGFGNIPGAILGGLLFGLIDAFSAGWFHGLRRRRRLPRLRHHRGRPARASSASRR